MDTPITRAEHEEFKRRLEEENKRQDSRLKELETNTRQIGAMVTSIEKLAVNMENMAKEQEKQGRRLQTLESRDGEKWRETVKYIGTALLGVILGFLTRFIGL